MNKGFSLLELSIVLVIIGLISGGIVAGSSMIRAAELRAVVTEYQQFQTAIHTFRDKYLGIPGDLKNATAFWGAEPAANCPGDETTPSTGTATCDGDGNRTTDDFANAGFGNERHRFWQHLANAGLISGTFTGVQGAGGYDHGIIAENAPASKLSGAGWSARDIGNHTWGGSTVRATANYGNAFEFGAERASNSTASAIMTAQEVWNLDKKIDDGKPFQGKVMQFYIACTDAIDGNDSDADYDLTVEDNSCSIIFAKAF